MSEHEEFMPPCLDTEKENACIECEIKLNHVRDGTTNSNHRCHNCYWREQNTRARQEKQIVPFICYRCENTFDWEPGIGNICNDCTE